MKIFQYFSQVQINWKTYKTYDVKETGLYGLKMYLM